MSELSDKRPFWETSRTVTHDEAEQAAKRFITGHFNNEGEHARVSIPANPERDDDLMLLSYILQRRRASALPAVGDVERIEAALEKVFYGYEIYKGSGNSPCRVYRLESGAPFGDALYEGGFDECTRYIRNLAATDIAALSAAPSGDVEGMREALKGLRNETSALLSCWEQSIREVAGNTNVACLKRAIETAYVALSAAPSGDGREGEKERPELDALLAEARERVSNMSPEELEEMLRLQRESWARQAKD